MRFGWIMDEVVNTTEIISPCPYVYADYLCLVGKLVFSSKLFFFFERQWVFSSKRFFERHD